MPLPTEAMGNHTPPFAEGVDTSPARSDHIAMGVVLPQDQLGVDMSPFDQGHLGADIFDFNQGQMEFGASQSSPVHVKPPAPVHPAIKQARRFCEYVRTAVDQRGPPPSTTFAWFLQRMNISNLGFSENSKNLLRQYVQDFHLYEQVIAVGSAE